jgi:hypothetical protein
MVEKEKVEPTVQKLKNLLTTTKRIVDYHNKLTIAKGEHFNLFSVLNIETKENKTHSAFLAELLNPEGSHKMGDVFLQHFMTAIKHNENLENKNTKSTSFVTDRASVKVEHSIPGKINLYNKDGEDKSKATGGRIDIYLKDKVGNYISIENKIHATDQEAQIQRYYNHENEKNIVYYLTLKGKNPKKFSRLNLIAGEDFFNISYRDEIVDWLELCLKEVPNFTGLREAINQYIILIKKLTHAMDTKQQEELLEVMMANIEESAFIANNYDKALINLRENFRRDLRVELEKRLSEDRYTVVNGAPIKNKFSQIWIHINNAPSPKIMFGIESFSGTGHKNGVMFVGLLDKEKSPLVEAIPEENRLNAMWKQVRYFKTKGNNNINLSDKYTLNILKDQSSEAYKALLSTCCNQTVEFINEYEKILPKELFVGSLVENNS